MDQYQDLYKNTFTFLGVSDFSKIVKKLIGMKLNKKNNIASFLIQIITPNQGHWLAVFIDNVNKKLIILTV
jgi:hypothetical protein